jgi:cytochrome P450
MSKIFNDLLGNSFLFSDGNEEWKLKRKACSPGFYKKNLQALMEAMKQIGLDTVTKWKAKINASPEKQITLNLTE